MSKCIKTAAVILMLAMWSIFLPYLMEHTYAAGEAGKLNDKSYTNFNSLVNDLKNDYKNKTVTIQMSED